MIHINPRTAYGCSLYDVTMYDLRHTMYIVQCTLYTIHCAWYTSTRIHTFTIALPTLSLVRFGELVEEVDMVCCTSCARRVNMILV